MSRHKQKTSRASTAIRCLALLAASLGAAQSLRAQEAVPAEQPTDVAVLRTARDALAAAADYVGARAPAEEIVALLDASTQGPSVDDLMLLARIQAELSEFEAAERNYLRAIQMVEDDSGETSPALIGPYQALGRSYINARRFPDAVVVLEQARDLSRRSAGLFNVEQSTIIDDLTAANIGLGNTVAARNLQVERLDNAVREFGTADPRVIPYHDHLGDYLSESRLRTSAREQYMQALAIQDAHYGTTDARLLATLRKLVQLDLLLGVDEGARTRLIEVLDRNPDAAANERALSLAVLGDCAAVAEDLPLARQYYADAFTEAAKAGPAEGARLFATPEMIDFIPPLSPVDRGTRSRPYLWGSISLEFDVSAEGRAVNVRNLTAEPPGFMDSAYVRRIRETHFRPKLLGAEPVPASNVRFTHYFRVYAAREG